MPANRAWVISGDPGLLLTRELHRGDTGPLRHVYVTGDRRPAYALGALSAILQRRHPNWRVLIDAEWLKAQTTQVRRVLERCCLTLSTEAAPAPAAGRGSDEHTAPILLVGDRPSRPGALWQRVPFCSLSRAGCSGYLAEQLEAAGVPEHWLAWVEAYDYFGNATDPFVVPRVGALAAVCMGAHAREWYVAAAGREPDAVVPHPMHHKRFGRGTPYPLGTAIWTIIHHHLERAA